jgi:hypothetical protein
VQCTTPADATHVIFSPVFISSPMTTTSLSSDPLASMQFPLSSTFVQVIVWAGPADSEPAPGLRSNTSGPWPLQKSF